MVGWSKTDTSKGSRGQQWKRRSYPQGPRERSLGFPHYPQISLRIPQQASPLSHPSPNDRLGWRLARARPGTRARCADAGIALTPSAGHRYTRRALLPLGSWIEGVDCEENVPTEPSQAQQSTRIPCTDVNARGAPHTR